MTIALVDFWDIDPLPTPPTGDQSSMAYWRWYSALTLAHRLGIVREIPQPVEVAL